MKFDTSLTETVPGFNEIVFTFNGDGYSEESNGDDGIRRKVIFDQANKKFVLRDNFSVEFYQSVKCPEEIARIYEGDVVQVSSETGFKTESIGVRLSADVLGQMIDDTFVLDGDNSFKKLIDDRFNYLEYDGTNLSVNHQSITYKATLKEFDRSTGSVISGTTVGEFVFGVENITDISDTKISSFELVIPNGVLSGSY